MPSDSFTKAFAYLLINEGVTYSNAVNDRGGPTKYGVTLATLIQWRKFKGRPAPTATDVQNLTTLEAGEMYEAWYWVKTGGDGLSQNSVATALFDAGVLTGTGWVCKGAQNIASQLTGTQLKIDGLIGPKTLAAVNACQPQPFLLAFVAYQQAHFIDIINRDATQRVYSKNWQRRAAWYLDLCV